MFTITAHTDPGTPEHDNEDFYAATNDVVVVLDGATIRTDTGCIHGLPWYVRQLGAQLLTGAADYNTGLSTVLANAIRTVSDSHAATCDLTHPGTPSAAVGITRINAEVLEWLVLGDITVMVDTPNELLVDADERVSSVGIPERRMCDQYLIGSDDKMAAIQTMKAVELAGRNQSGGYWIASVVPEAAGQSLRGAAPLDQVQRFAVCSDGATRALTMTPMTTHASLMNCLVDEGPSGIISRVRGAENTDYQGVQWPRNKRTDDATVVLATRRPAI